MKNDIISVFVLVRVLWNFIFVLFCLHLIIYMRFFVVKVTPKISSEK